MSTDALTPFVLEHASVRGALVTLPHTVRTVLACHPYPAVLARVLGELCAATTLLASTLKFTGTIAAQMTGDGPVRLLVVECSATLGVRAMAQWDAARLAELPPDATLAQLAGAGAGRMVLTLDPKDGGAIYQGIVDLAGTSVAAAIEHYLATSEQLASRMLLASDDRGTAGFLLQRLPGDEDAQWRDAVAQIDRIDPAHLLNELPATTMLAQLLPEHDLRIFDAQPVAFACACSRERVERALRIAGRGEVESIVAEKGFVDVTCEFCNRKYVFSPAEARTLFRSPDAH